MGHLNIFTYLVKDFFELIDWYFFYLTLLILMVWVRPGRQEDPHHGGVLSRHGVVQRAQAGPVQPVDGHADTAASSSFQQQLNYAEVPTYD